MPDHWRTAEIRHTVLNLHRLDDAIKASKPCLRTILGLD